MACQQSGGGARMASTFGGVLSLSNRSIWANNFTDVEVTIGKSEIHLGTKIINQNLQNEIAVSPMDLTLKVVNVFLPKRLYFCRTICVRSRTYLAMSAV